MLDLQKDTKSSVGRGVALGTGDGLAWRTRVDNRIRGAEATGRVYTQQVNAGKPMAKKSSMEIWWWVGG